MKKIRHLIHRSTLYTVPIVLACVWPLAAQAQTLDELRREQNALQDKVDALERKLNASPSESGMTAQEKQDFNRIAIKTEALEDNLDLMGFRGLKVSGQMDPTYIYNQRQHRAGFQFLNRVEDDGYHYDNSFFGMAMLDVQKEMESGTRWRITIAPNRGAGAVFDGDSPVHEASVSVPLSDLQTRFIAGQIPDWSGYEYLQPTLNKLITHNLLFDYTLPTAYTGAGLEVARGKWLVKAMLANMNATRRAQKETAPVLAYRVDYARGEFQGFGFAGVHGKAANATEVYDITGERVPQRDSTVHLVEIDGYFIRGDWTAQTQLTYGQQERASISANPSNGRLRTARWWGWSTLAAHKLTPRLEAVVRMDYVYNRAHGGGLLGYAVSDGRSGIGPGWQKNSMGTWTQVNRERGANRFAVSLGASYRFNLHTTLKAEYRLDGADQPVFVDIRRGDYQNTNHLVGLGVVVGF